MSIEKCIGHHIAIQNKCLPKCTCNGGYILDTLSTEYSQLVVLMPIIRDFIEINQLPTIGKSISPLEEMPDNIAILHKVITSVCLQDKGNNFNSVLIYTNTYCSLAPSHQLLIQYKDAIDLMTVSPSWYLMSLYEAASPITYLAGNPSTHVVGF